MGKIGLIIGREYLSRVKKRSFIILTLLGPLLIAGLISLVLWLAVEDEGKHKIIVVDETYPQFSKLKSNNQVSFDYAQITLDEAKLLFFESDHDGILYIPKNIIGGDLAILYFKKQPSLIVQQVIENKVQGIVEEIKLKEYKISRDDFYKVKTPLTIKPVKFSETGKEEDVQNERTFVGFMFGLLIYFFIFLYGVQVMRGVIEEKTNRIVEVIISSVKPFQLMLGKIIGVAMVGLTQFVIWIVLTITITVAIQSVILSEFYDASDLGNVQMTEEVLKASGGGENLPEEFNLLDPNNPINRVNLPLMIGLFIFYFIGGYLLYSALFAAVGAAVDSETDTQQFMIPLTLPLTLAYIMSLVIIQNPEGPVAFWFSIIPFTSPIVMLVRVAIGVGDGGIPIWEVALSMSLLILGFLFMVWLSGKIYRTGILMYGKKVSYRELWKWLRYSN